MSNEIFTGANGAFEILPNNAFKITLNKDGRKEAKNYKNKTDEDFLWDMFEDIFCNSSLQFLQPEDIGALTDSVIIGYDIPKDDAGEIQDFDGQEKIWWFPNYMVTSIAEQLEENKECVLTYVE